MKFIVFVVLISLVQCQAKSIVNVIEYDGSNITAGVIKCLGTLITEEHILTTANCASFPSGRALGVAFLDSNYHERYPVEKISQHPDYVNTNNFKDNLAVLKLASSANYSRTIFKPQDYNGTIGVNASCTIYNIDGVETNEAAIVLAPGLCDSGNKTYCSAFETAGANCGAVLGSPLVCGAASTISGIMVGGHNGCIIKDNKNWIYYHSVQDYKDWIKDVSAASLTSKVSIFMVLCAILMKFIA